MAQSNVSGPFKSTGGFIGGADGGISTAGTVNAAATISTSSIVDASSGGWVFSAGDYKQFAAGTYIGSGAATAAIVDTGLTTIHHVHLQRNWQSRTAGATTRSSYSPSPAIAAGTPGSFYPLVGFIAPGAAVNHTLGIGAAATFSYVAVGEA